MLIVIAQERIVQGERIVVVPGGARAPQATTDYYKLKAQESELQKQLENLQNRRDDLARQTHGRTGTDLAGVESRLQIVDQRLAGLETELINVQKEVAVAAPASIAVPAPITRWRGYSEDDMWSAGFGGAAVMFALFVPFMIRSFRRRKFVPRGTTTPAVGSEKIDRMEQSIEAIAVEIERVSENQRFMTRLMTETQLAGTIAAVRGSTEAAKAAAENASNV